MSYIGHVRERPIYKPAGQSRSHRSSSRERELYKPRSLFFRCPTVGHLSYHLCPTSCLQKLAILSTGLTRYG